MREKKTNTIKIAKTSQGEIETLASFRVFKLELSRLHKLYDNSVYAYQTAREVVYGKIKSGELRPEEEINFESYDNNKFRIARAQSSAHNFRVQYPRFLRELIFVRIISAFEIFLVDSIKETFLINKKLLKPEKEEVLKISENEFLSYSSIEEALEKYIERKCRSLHSRGYEELKKFYVKNLDIDFAKSKISASKITKYHDQRHLLVHRLGKTDAHYRHKYSTEEKLVQVNENYLLEISKDLNILVFYINQKIIDLLKSA